MLAVYLAVLSLGAAVLSLTFVLVTGFKVLLGAGPAIYLTASALSAFPAGRAMDRFGRVPVIVAGFILGSIGCLLTAGGTHWSSTLLVIPGFVLIGVSGAVTLLIRTAAGDMYPPERRARGISLVLFGSLWLPWYATSGNPNSVIESSGTGPNSEANAWEVFATFDWLVLLACTAPFILTWIIMRGHALSWNPGEVTMIVGITCFVLILCNGVILGKPEPDIEISLSYGWFVGLLAAAGLIAAGYLRQAVYTQARKPPGTF